METNVSMQKVPLDFQYFIWVTIQKKMAWSTLSFLLTDLAGTPEKSKQVIKILVKELQHWVSKVENEPNSDVTGIHGAEKADDLFEDDILNDKADSEVITDDPEFGKNTFESKGEEFIDESKSEPEMPENSERSKTEVDFDANDFYEFIGDNETTNAYEVEHSKDETLSNHDILQDDEDQNEKDSFHTNEKPFECNICQKTFNHQSELKNHERIHNGKKAHTCQTCNKCFLKTIDLRRHERTHTREKPFQCKFCQKTFSLEYGQKVHERIHTGERPYNCQNCNKCFISTSDLKKHGRIHTGEKPFQCQTCQKYFNDLGNLKKHNVMHLDEKPFECKTCLKSFKRQNDLKRHDKIHTREKPYKCLTCNACFRFSGTLKTHERSHTGEKSFQCKKFVRHHLDKLEI